MEAPGSQAPGPAYDEAYEQDGSPRPHYAELLDSLGDPGALAAEFTRRTLARGMAFPVDPVPRVLTRADWSELQLGIGQRLRALEAFVADVYGEGHVFEAGVLARKDVERSPHFEPAMRGAAPARWITYAGLDVIRCEDGRFRVIEDQVRMPSGLAYAVGMRETLRELLPTPPPQQDTSPAFGEIALALREAALPGAEEALVVVLSEGPAAATFWEHERLSRELCAPLVTLGDLEHRDGRLLAWLDDRPRAVDVVYLRTDDDRFTKPDGSPTAVGAALLEPCAAGKLACVNAPGAGVADDKLVHARVDELVRLYLDQEALLPSVPARRLDPDEPLDGLVVKPRGEMGGAGVTIWRDADSRAKGRIRAALARDPGGWIGQELVTLSVHPTVCNGRLEPRHVDLRPYALVTDAGTRVLEAGLSRVALERGSMIVNSAQGGGSKDMWAPS